MISRRKLICALGLIAFAGLSLSCCGPQLAPGTYAEFITSEGNFTCRLYASEAPMTVANFIGLVEGTKEWRQPRTNVIVKKPFYNGLIFHRVLKGFMIQSGCPRGDGKGGPGYIFADEFNDKLKFDRAGLLAMANSGANTNGSQFFITLGPAPHLNHLHTIFGEVVSGMDVVEKIGQSKTCGHPYDRPINDVVIKEVKIETVRQ
jgi:peptidyl-prolyl cis-trans isomerase A (cyclophilin A)